MTSSHTFELDRLLDRLEEDLSSGDYTARYDPSGDIFTLVFARPESPVTSHDRTDGVYLDFDPDEPRLTALTVVNYRSRFVPRHAPAPTPGLVGRLELRLLLVLDRLGIHVARYWDRYAGDERFRRALRDYRAALRSNPGQLEGLVPTAATA